MRNHIVIHKHCQYTTNYIVIHKHGQHMTNYIVIHNHVSSPHFAW